MFATGTQLVALAGALELFFAGWELIGISSALFIGFFHERDEPVRSSVRAFATYRLSDAGLLIATVTTFEFLGLDALLVAYRRGALPPARRPPRAAVPAVGDGQVGAVAVLGLAAARDGRTDAVERALLRRVSIHAGLFLLLRVWPLFEVSPLAGRRGRRRPRHRGLRRCVVRVHTDAKGALAHATLSQVGLILAEICLGWTTLALVHLVCHALLRLGQYLKAPNMIHDTPSARPRHRAPALLERWSPRLAARIYAAALHRWRLDDWIDMAFSPVLSLASASTGRSLAAANPVAGRPGVIIAAAASGIIVTPLAGTA